MAINSFSGLAVRGEALSKAVEWCREQNLEFDAVNDNLPENAKA